jgi:bifunctional DNase/RNase
MIPVTIHSIATDEDEDRFFAVLATENETNERWLPVQIGPSEAVSIATELSEEGSERPGTHDLLQTTLSTLDARVASVTIDRGEEHLEATLATETPGGEGLEFEARPSDALAIGLRSDAEVTVSEELMNEASQDAAQFQDHFAHAHPSSEVTRLRHELEEAVAEEDYERAAELNRELQAAARRYEESADLDEGEVEELRQAFEGSEAISDPEDES